MKVFSTITDFIEHIPDIEKAIEHTFSHKELLISACIHRSFLNEHKELTYTHNERLEFLGDSVLNTLITEFLFDYKKAATEGELSKCKAYLISKEACLFYMQTVRATPYILASRGEYLHSGKLNTTIIANAFEALLGAVFYDTNSYEQTKLWFWKHQKHIVLQLYEQPKINAKAQLQEYLQIRYKKLPIYKLLEAIGPDHAKIFTVAVFVEDTLLATAQAATKKEAEQKAASAALEKLSGETA